MKKMLILLFSIGVIISQTYNHTLPNIIGYRIVPSTQLGCWSELDIFWDMEFISEDERELIKKKIIQYELHRDEGYPPLVSIKQKDGSSLNYHIVKLPSDTFWRD